MARIFFINMINGRSLDSFLRLISVLSLSGSAVVCPAADVAAVDAAVVSA